MKKRKSSKQNKIFRLSPVCIAVGMCLFSFAYTSPVLADDVYINTDKTFYPGEVTSSDNLFIGSDAGNTFLVNNGNTLQTKNGYIGTVSGTSGTLTVSGTGTEVKFLQWDENRTYNNAILLLGSNKDHGLLNIINGASVWAGSTVVNNGNIDVNGSDSQLIVIYQSSGYPATRDQLLFTIGNTDNGSVTVHDGGKLTVDPENIGATFSSQYALFIGREAGSSGTLTISGTDDQGNASLLITPDMIVVGDSGKGTLAVENGGSLKNTYGGFFLGGGYNTKKHRQGNHDHYRDWFIRGQQRMDYYRK
ncbi:putative autotransporter [Escherichia coli M605]|uniref:Putative autotransporter n=1 Tax=Escherichia coli M605 TaxID=656417 RepID=F4SYC3_ECOLX|nr:putative autotransporter [Escherichia coli]EGI16370.1 putative autotransporter [Escherichia coli M605]